MSLKNNILEHGMKQNISKIKLNSVTEKSKKKIWNFRGDQGKHEQRKIRLKFTED